jgi:hypothetical protein
LRSLFLLTRLLLCSLFFVSFSAQTANWLRLGASFTDGQTPPAGPSHLYAITGPMAGFALHEWAQVNGEPVPAVRYMSGGEVLTREPLLDFMGYSVYTPPCLYAGAYSQDVGPWCGYWSQWQQVLDAHCAPGTNHTVCFFTPQDVIEINYVNDGIQGTAAFFGRSDLATVGTGGSLNGNQNILFSEIERVIEDAKARKIPFIVVHGYPRNAFNFNLARRTVLDPQASTIDKATYEALKAAHKLRFSQKSGVLYIKIDDVIPFPVGDGFHYDQEFHRIQARRSVEAVARARGINLRQAYLQISLDIQKEMSMRIGGL